MGARRTAAGLVAGAMALTLVAAETPVAGAGSAETSMLGAEIQVTGPLQTPVVRVLDLVTAATTIGTPMASTGVVPLQVGDTPVGATGASSDGTTSSSTDGGSFGDLAGSLGVVVQPMQTEASASADRALATVGAALVEVGALLGQLGVELDSTGATSLVTREGASATQGLQVSELSLSLGNLGLDPELLGSLDLASILDLLASLPGLLPADLVEVGQIQSLLDELDAALATLAMDGAAASSLLDQLTATAEELAALESLLATLVALESLSLADLLIALTDVDLLADLEAVGCALGTVDPLDPFAALSDAIACVEAEIASVTATLDQLTGLLPDELAPVLAGLDEIVAIVEQVLAGVADLDDLLADLPDLLAGASGTELLGIGAFDVGTTAVAAATAEDSSATLLCEPLDVRVLGTALATPDCSEGLGQLPDVSATIDAAVTQVVDVLNSLPLGDLVQVGELRASVFTDLVEQVTETDGVVTSTAGITLLDLAVPSVTLDPTQVTGALGDLGLPDVLGPIEDVLGELESGLTTLQALGVTGADTLLTTVSDSLASVGAPDGLTGTVDQVAALLAGLDLADLGSLTEAVSTPGLELLVDPVATATFSAAASGGTPTTGPPPAPAPTPSLPSTGGGLAVLGLLALAGAAGLRRRS